MTRSELVAYLRAQAWAVQATVNDAAAPQAAVIGVAVAAERYFARFPDGRDRERWPDIAYWSVTPTWIRYLDVTTLPPTLLEWHGDRLAELLSS